MLGDSNLATSSCIHQHTEVTGVHHFLFVCNSNKREIAHCTVSQSTFNSSCTTHRPHWCLDIPVVHRSTRSPGMPWAANLYSSNQAETVDSNNNGVQVPNESDLELALLVHSALHRQLLSPANQKAIKPTDAVLTAIRKSQPPLVLEQSL